MAVSRARAIRAGTVLKRTEQLFSVTVSYQILCPEVDNSHSGSVDVHCVLVSVKMGGAINCSLISTHLSISAYFLTVHL